MGAITSRTTPPTAAGGEAASGEQQQQGFRSGNVSFTPELLHKLQDEQKMRMAKASAQAPAHQLPLPSLDPISPPSAQQLERAMQFRQEASLRAIAANARAEARAEEQKLAERAEEALAIAKSQLQRRALLEKPNTSADKNAKTHHELVHLLTENSAPMNQVFSRMRVLESSMT